MPTKSRNRRSPKKLARRMKTTHHLSWNVSNVEYMVAMFANANSFNQPLNNWNVSKVESMVGMFDEATSFNQPLHAPWYAVEQSDSE